MSEPPLARQDEDAYWRSGKEFVRVLIAELNRVLRQQGVWKRKRRQICSEFAFEFAQFLDQRWMKVNGTTEYPLLCFVRTFLDLDVPLADVSPINAPHKSVELHAMVADEIRWFFDEMKERPGAITIGDVGAETPDTGPTDEPVVMKDLPCWTCGAGQSHVGGSSLERVLHEAGVGQGGLLESPVSRSTAEAIADAERLL